METVPEPNSYARLSVAIEKVIRRIAPTVLIDLIAQLMFQHAGIEYVHLCGVAQRDIPSARLRPHMRGGRPFIEVSAYRSVLAGMELEENRARKHFWRGFALWRLYRHHAAATELNASLNALSESEADWEINELVIRRVYLENLRDMLRQTVFRRKAVWHHYDGERSYHYVADQLRLPYNMALHGRDEERRLLSRIILIEIDVVLGRPVAPETVRELIARAEALKHNNPAFSATRLLLSLGPRGFYQGFRSWRRLSRIFLATKNGTSYVKGLASLLYAAAPNWTRPFLCKINNRVAGCIKVMVQEVRVGRALRAL